jgi:hypothetical protein
LPPYREREYQNPLFARFTEECHILERKGMQKLLFIIDKKEVQMNNNERELEVKIYDAVMGSGKTTFIINQMNKMENRDRKWIYITPNLSECERIDNACPMLDFKHPSNDKTSKLKDLQKLVENEENIVSTHALLTHFTKETLELLKNRDYHLVLDEAIEPCMKYKIQSTDIEILFKSKYVGLSDDGITLEWLEDRPQFDSKFYYEYKLIENENLVMFDFNESKKNKKVFIWEMTPSLFNSFMSVTILTYQFDGSYLRAYFDIKNIKYTINTKALDRGIKLGHLINICEHKELNKIGRHKQSLASSLKKDPKKCNELGTNIYNYVRNIVPTKANNIMSTTFKDAWKSVKGKGYATSFLSHNTKATNDYAHKTTLVYGLNRYMDVPVKQYLESRGVTVNEDLWALNEMLQWIFRSAIRNDEPIFIYVPNSRMRELLLDWTEHN